MLAFDPYPGVRIVALPAALDALASLHPRLVRFAPDEAFIPAVAVSDLTADPLSGIAGDEHAIVEADAGWSAGCCSWAKFDEIVAPLVDWPIPTERPALAQGWIAAVPCKVVFADDGIVIITQSAHVRDLEARL